MEPSIRSYFFARPEWSVLVGDEGRKDRDADTVAIPVIPLADMSKEIPVFARLKCFVSVSHTTGRQIPIPALKAMPVREPGDDSGSLFVHPVHKPA